MSKYLEFPLPGGGNILIETPDERKPGRAVSSVLPIRPTPRTKPHRRSRHPLKAFSATADVLVRQLQSLDTSLTRSSFFNLKAVGELGKLVVGRTNSDANFNVTLKWHREAPESEKDEPSKG